MEFARDSDGKLTKWAWSGGYPLFYLTKRNDCLCPSCANKNDEDDDPIVACDANWEDPFMFCDGCSERIESAYTEPEECAECKAMIPYLEPCKPDGTAHAKDCRHFDHDAQED